MMHSEVKRALNTWIAAKAALNPLRRGIAHWRNAPLKKAFNSMSHNVRRREKMRAVVYRLRHRLVSKAVVTWRARIASGLLRRLTKLGKAWVHHPKRKALNTWIAYYRGQRRLLGLVKTFKGDATRRGFNTWRAATQRRLGITLGAPNNLRSIRAMTWREAVGWLHSMGIRVSRSPPTLLRTLRAGGPYQGPHPALLAHLLHAAQGLPDRQRADPLQHAAALFRDGARRARHRLPAPRRGRPRGRQPSSTSNLSRASARSSTRCAPKT